VLDLLLKGVRLPGAEQVTELGVRDGLIAAPEPEAREVIDLKGSLLTPALVEPHIHLDAVLTVGEPRQNQTGSLFEGIAIWGERVKSLTVEDVKRLGRSTQGVIVMRLRGDERVSALAPVVDSEEEPAAAEGAPTSD